MYGPRPFAVEDRRELVAYIERRPFGILVSNVEGKPFATHVPFIVLADAESLTLGLHLAKANPQWKAVEEQEVLAIFHGPHAFVSAGWYTQPQTSVPTWNYAAVHCIGRARLADAVQTANILQRTVERFDASWRMQDADQSYIAAMRQAITGIELTVTSIEGNFKYSQNRSADDRARVIDALDASPRAMDREVAQEMRGLR